MYTNNHIFHIPVMGLGHSVDSPIRVAHLGINSVISIVDDLLLEKVRKHYCKKWDLPYKNIPRTADDGRAKRITAYLDTVKTIVDRKFAALKDEALFTDSEKDRYFKLLPESSLLRKKYEQIRQKNDNVKRSAPIEELNDMMRPGAIDVNIMSKVDALSYDSNQNPLSPEYSDASAALRGFANSSLQSSVVLSAGFNPRLYSYISEFDDFYRNSDGTLNKKIILKVSDYRSALIQGKFLAKKGLEVAELRIESGLNCGGHAFPSDGQLMPVLLREFKEQRDKLGSTFMPLIQKYHEGEGQTYPVDEEEIAPSVTVQGGIGTHGEMQRLLQDYKVDGTGWGSPFLLVEEATCVDEETSLLLKESTEDDLYLSNVSPFGIPFNNLRGTGSEKHTLEQIEKDKPGSKCPKGFLVSNTEFTENPICTASSEYQLLKINDIEESELSRQEKEQQKENVLQKTCLCRNLGTGALIRLGIRKPSYGRQAVCPGPNIAWFNDQYTLNEMVDHIYGRSESLVPPERPHMFAKELVMYVDYLEELIDQAGDPDDRSCKKMHKNLEKGIEYCLEISGREPFEGENLESLRTIACQQKERLEELFMMQAV